MLAGLLLTYYVFEIISKSMKHLHTRRINIKHTLSSESPGKVEDRGTIGNRTFSFEVCFLCGYYSFMRLERTIESHINYYNYSVQRTTCTIMKGTLSNLTQWQMMSEWFGVHENHVSISILIFNYLPVFDVGLDHNL